jgi:hypothetical protein
MDSCATAATLDKLWHQLFGIDVTLWAPMHLIGIMGLTLASFGGLVSAWREQRLAVNEERRRHFGRVTLFFAAAVLCWDGSSCSWQNSISTPRNFRAYGIQCSLSGCRRRCWCAS